MVSQMMHRVRVDPRKVEQYLNKQINRFGTYLAEPYHHVSTVLAKLSFK